MPAPEYCHDRPMDIPRRGLSIVELMVSTVVALLVGLAATGSAVVFTASQRQGLGVGSAALNGAAALAAIKRDVAAAGLGFFGDSTFRCHTLNLSVYNTVITDASSFTPALITSLGNNDRIDIVYASQISAGTSVLLNAASDGSSVELRSLLPASVGQAVLLAPATPGSPCLLRSITAMASATADSKQQLSFARTGRYNQVVFPNSPAFPDKSSAALFGDLVWSRYRLDGTDLLMERPMFGDSAVLHRNVVGLRAQYGVAAAGGTTIERWQDASGPDFAAMTSATLPRVRALRIGLVTRSAQREKEAASGHCEASMNKPELFGNTVDPDLSDWACYRYRSAVTVVPLRNFVWGLAP